MLMVTIRSPRTARAFTLVEMLIAVVIIAILAAIALVAYNGLQQRARDSERMTELAAISKLMKLYKIDKGGYPGTGTGCASGLNGSGSGWYSRDDGNATWPKSVMKCLDEAGYTTANVLDPSNAVSCANNDLSCHAYLVSWCAAGAWLFVNMETMPQSSTTTDNTCVGADTWDTLYGANYALRIE